MRAVKLKLRQAAVDMPLRSADEQECVRTIRAESLSAASLIDSQKTGSPSDRQMPNEQEKHCESQRFRGSTPVKDLCIMPAHSIERMTSRDSQVKLARCASRLEYDQLHEAIAYTLAASDNTRNSRVLAHEPVPANSPGSRLWAVLHK